MNNEQMQPKRANLQNDFKTLKLDANLTFSNLYTACLTTYFEFNARFPSTKNTRLSPVFFHTMFNVP